MAVASLVLGIVSLLFALVPGVGTIIGIIGACCAKGNRDESMRGMASGGMACSWAGLGINLLITLFIIIFVAFIAPTFD